MNPKTTAILFLVAAALAAFVWLYEIEGGEQRKEAEEASKRLFPGVEQEAIDAISLHTTDGVDVKLERVDGAWRITSPIAFPADEFAADGLAAALSSILSESVIEDPREPSVYGLDDETRVVRFSAGGEDHELRGGDKAPVGANAYASVGGSDAVDIVESYRVESLRKSFDDLREKRIARFDAASVEGLTLSWPEGRVVLERDDDGWAMTAPIQGRADDTTVDGVLSDLSFLRADGFVDEPTPEQSAALEPPAFSARISLRPPGEAEEGGEGAAAPLVLQVAIGATTPDGSKRLVRGGETSLYTIPAEGLDDFPVELAAYRFRQLAKFPVLDARRIEFGFQSAQGATVGITATRGDDGWSSQPEAFAEGKLDAIVGELARLRADSIWADALGDAERAAIGLEPPNASIRVFGDGDEPIAQVDLGKPAHDGVPARIPGQPIIFRLAPDAAEHIPVSYEAFTNRFAAPPDSAPEGPADAPTIDAPTTDAPATQP